MRVAEAEGYSLADVEFMVQRSAITSHERGNRRYRDWLFNVEDDEVFSMTKFNMTTDVREGSTSLTMYEDCPSCVGKGCKDCGWVGTILAIYK